MQFLHETKKRWKNAFIRTYVQINVEFLRESDSLQYLWMDFSFHFYFTTWPNIIRTYFMHCLYSSQAPCSLNVFWSLSLLLLVFLSVIYISFIPVYVQWHTQTKYINSTYAKCKILNCHKDWSYIVYTNAFSLLSGWIPCLHKKRRTTARKRAMKKNRLKKPTTLQLMMTLYCYVLYTQLPLYFKALCV